MSGIVGIINLDGAPVDRELLGRMTDFMSFRGPDAQEIWIDGNVGFGHTMLRTTFEAETEKQPLTLDGKVWLTADARIDGRAELIAELEGKLGRRLRVHVPSNGHGSPSNDHGSPSNGHGSDPRVPNDAELILYAYEAWGEDCVKHLIGDFAFAIWDSRQRRLFCARDHFGVKQFYYAQVGNTFIFSNTLNCLRMHPAVSDELNEVAMGDYLLFGLNQDLSSTAFHDIHRLPQASSLTASNNNKKIQLFWSAPRNGEIQFRNSADYVERFKELFSLAVRDRLRTNKVSVSMSGGLDSTSVAAVARDLLLRQSADAEVRGYVVVFDRLIPDEERRYSTLAAAALEIPVTHIAADDFLLYEERRPGELERPEPFLVNADSSKFNELLRSMAEHSRVALSGWDGDAFMNEPPNAQFAELAKRLKLKKLLANMGWFLWARHQLPPVGFRTRIKRLLGTYPPKAFCPAWIDESFSNRVNLPERWKKFTSEPVKAHPTRPYAFRVLISTSWAPLFESYDPGFTRLPFEMRHPIIDVRLVEYLLSLPPVPWCVNKEILRVAMAGKLPTAVLNRPKTPLAGDPALYQVKESSVRFVDNFEPVASLTRFVDLSALPRIAGEQNSDRLWANLRPFAFNHWLQHSLPIGLTTDEENGKQNKDSERTSRGEKGIPSPSTFCLR
jgi:asparagine synthase (glutamine-hydrolysing)